MPNSLAVDQYLQSVASNESSLFLRLSVKHDLQSLTTITLGFFVRFQTTR